MFKIRIRGLKEVNRALRQLGPELELPRHALNGVAQDPRSAIDEAALHEGFCRGAVALRKGSVNLAKSEAAELVRRSKALGNRRVLEAAHQLLGIIALETGDYAKAVSELKQADSRDPYNMFRLAQVYQRQGDVAGARKMFSDITDYRSPLNLHYSFVRHQAEKKLAQQYN